MLATDCTSAGRPRRRCGGAFRAGTPGARGTFRGGAPAAFADTNIRRVLGRALLGRIASEREAVALDEQLVPDRGADRWHYALMDLGATVCLARTPRCEACPIAVDCRSRGRVVRAAPRRQAAFATSDRRVRGRIIALLRERDAMTEPALRRAIGDARAGDLLAALVGDGLVERAGRSV